ncbi:SusC/RagA family TonB-linked outer membrane protein [Mucilaginibacter aquatilis]|uniref:SusC/RagA family TonB-linked outer membrane protein n=1 Tax=Mucilaginibacter aquatilis TaxID=1517760 RepID=A0A6I4IPV9_9SPHI|nr:SusC/RagA family TonB-linked outer membrane protein [Mucilaginibacter aquatilis]MVN90703.1 SusC/RagA family TonB-linked outer membrane protein [Mucilaginibacter aquatilis]
MKKILQRFLWGLLVFVGSQAYAQTRTVTGTVTAKSDGLPLPGVSVRAEGNQVGTQTGSDGKFSLKVPENATLIFSFIGFTSQSIPIAGKGSVDVALVQSSGQLNEVVVTGVGAATSKRQVPIDVATLSSKDFPKSATTNATQALQGQIAGAQIVQRSGQPGASPLIQLRGFTNLGSTSPLILIDGVQADNNILTSIDPNIIDRIEVVKGAAGGMLYGAVGGNGVIQVFTKKGAKNGRFTIDISSRYSRDQVIKKNELVASNHHWVTNADGAILASGGAVLAPNAIGVWPDPVALPYATDKTVQNNKPFLLPTYDHIDQGNRVATTLSNALNIRGGSEKVDYAFGFSNLKQQDVYSNDFSRTNMNMNIGFNPVAGLTLRSNTQFFYTYENLLSSNRFNLVNSFQWIDFNYINPATGMHVVKPSTLIDGNNPLAEREARTRNAKTPRLLQNFNINYKFPKFVELDAKYSIDQRNGDYYDYYYNQSGRPQTVFFGGNINGSITNEFEQTRLQTANASLFFRTDFQNDFKSKLPIKTTTQVTYEARKTNYRYYYAQGSILPPFPPANINVATTKTSGDDYSETLLYGILVNQTIDYGSLFGISAGFRSDYSSAFGGQSKPFTFPRGTVYINPSEFFSSKSLVPNWKLRAAYGEAGVQPGAYDRQPTLVAGALGTEGSALYNRSTLPNPNLNVQVTKELEFGTDVTLTPMKDSPWLSSISLSGTYWRRTSDDVIQNAPAATSTGASGVIDNLVSLKSNGVDLTLDATAYRSENFTWNLGVRWANANTYITQISNNLPITNSFFTIAPGGDLGELYMQTPLTSVDQLRPDGTRYIPAANVGNYTIVNGNVVNLANYNVVLTATDDQKVVGNVNPDFTSSLINRFTVYKNLSVGLQFDWIKGASIYNSTRQWLYRDRLHADFDKPVNINGQEGAFVAYYNSFYNTNSALSYFVEDGSFVRFRDLSISYDVTSLVKQKWLRSLVVTLTGRNLATWTNYKGLDPEATSSQNNQGGAVNGLGSFRGVDRYGAPNVKSYQFSLNIGF